MSAPTIVLTDAQCIRVAALLSLVPPKPPIAEQEADHG